MTRFAQPVVQPALGAGRLLGIVRVVDQLGADAGKLGGDACKGRGNVELLRIGVAAFAIGQDFLVSRGEQCRLTSLRRELVRGVARPIGL